MSLEVLEKFASESGNEELINAFNGVKKSVGDNINRMKFLEQESKSAFEKRDTLSNIVKSKLGLDEINDESIDSFLSKMNKNPDAAMKADNDKLASMVDMLKTEKDGLNAKLQQTANSYKVEKQLTKLGAIEETEGAKAYDIVLAEVTSGASFDDTGEIIFKANDGTTIRNADGSPMSLADRYAQVKDSDELSFLFKTKRSKQGGGSQGGSTGSSKITSLDGLNDAQRLALFRQDPEQFKRLSNK
jgi:hypothetical protein